jgi:hypothetical protein
MRIKKNDLLPWFIQDHAHIAGQLFEELQKLL